MKRFLVSGAALVAILFVVACEKNTPQRQTRPSGFRPTRPPIEDPADRISTEPSEPSTTTSTTVTTNETPPPAPTPAPQLKNYDYGKPVPGKPGFVTSPYAPTQGYVDVRDFSPGTEVKDPYTGKIFLVP